MSSDELVPNSKSGSVIPNSEAGIGAVRGKPPNFRGEIPTNLPFAPVPFSITTLEDGRFLDVNAAFERRYGYT